MKDFRQEVVKSISPNNNWKSTIAFFYISFILLLVVYCCSLKSELPKYILLFLMTLTIQQFCSKVIVGAEVVAVVAVEVKL